jgi:hypothetical protein
LFLFAVSSSESYSSYEPVNRYGEVRREFPSTIDEDDFNLTPTSDTSLVDEVMSELASKNIMPPCMMDLSEPNTPRALPNESFLFSSAVQNCSNKVSHNIFNLVLKSDLLHKNIWHFFY